MINGANIRKTYYYLKRNGIKNTFYAVCERILENPNPQYCYAPISEEERTRQTETVWEEKIKFSILVPMYETAPVHATEMIQSVLDQTYPYFELILADASKSDTVFETVRSFCDKRIRYERLTTNGGISENTNAALQLAKGEYTALLDHDDLLTPDALYEMASAITAAGKEGKPPAFLYSDEDKCDSKAEIFYEPNIKPGFNLDLLLSNNYICHFLVMDTELMKKTGFRKEYDGAQDFDLILRAYTNKEKDRQILHIGKVLYHWRCHALSTAENPQSKQYAYEAGRRAVEDFLAKEQMEAKVIHTKHNGFYRIVYDENPQKIADAVFAQRKDIGILSGPLYTGNKITGGIYNKNMECPYTGLNRYYSGYLHRAALQQDTEMADIRNMVIREELLDIVRNALENMKLNHELTNEFLPELLHAFAQKDTDEVNRVLHLHKISEETISLLNRCICGRIREEGRLIYWDPQFLPPDGKRKLTGK